MTEKKHSLIIAPHPDDELIGCFEILNDPNQSITIIYGADATAARRKEALKLREVFPNVGNQVFHASVPSTYITTEITLYFPDPSTENHPAHRGWGSLGEALARDGLDVVFYSTIMNTPYIHECKDSMKKEAMLDRVYESQKQMWAYEKKYILFEGRCKWMF